MVGENEAPAPALSKTKKVSPSCQVILNSFSLILSVKAAEDKLMQQRQQDGMQGQLECI